MVQYASGSIKMTGLGGNNIDFKTMLDQLTQIEGKYARQLLRWKADWQKRLDAFRQVRTELLNMQTALSKINTMDKFLVKTASSSDSNVVTAVAGSDVLNGTYSIDVLQLASQSSWSYDTGITNKSDIICPVSGGAGTFRYTYKGTTRTLTIPEGTSLDILKNIINNDAQNPGVRAQLITSTSGIIFQLQGKDTGFDNALTTPFISNIAVFVGGPGVLDGGQNAKFLVNGLPSSGSLESASNNIAAGQIIDGLSLSLRSVGNVVISVTDDTQKIADNVVAFVDAVNSFRSVLQQLTAFNESKKVLDPDYAESQFEMQKGSVLTGNYGIQLLSSRLKSTVAGAAAGFGSGDFFSSLSQIGITTNAEQGNINFGLLEINTIPGYKGSKSLEEALAENPEAVARLFSANGEGKSNNPGLFQFNSLIPGTTKAGTYSVEYTSNGSAITSASINGNPANISGSQITAVTSGDPARGLALDIYDLTPTPPAHTGSVSILAGKVNELLGLLNNEDTLKTLEKNYQTIIDNIDKKIKQEDDRLVKWRRTMDMKFARLDATMARYNKISESLKSQLAQMNSQTSSSK